MKKLTTKDTKIAEFTRLSSQLSPRQLFRTNQDQYVLVVLLDRDTATFAFHSEVFTALLNDLGGGITDVTLINMTDPERSEDGDDLGFEIRLHLKNGEIASINSQDQVHLMLPTNYGNEGDETPATSVYELWNLPDIYPFSHLQISEGLIKLMRPLVDDTSPTKVLNQLWRDYQRISQNHSAPINYCTTVVAEHFTFVVTEHTCGRVTLSL